MIFCLLHSVHINTNVWHSTAIVRLMSKLQMALQKNFLKTQEKIEYNSRNTTAGYT